MNQTFQSYATEPAVNGRHGAGSILMEGLSLGRTRLPCSLFYYITYSSFTLLAPSFAADLFLMPGQSGTVLRWPGSVHGPGDHQRPTQTCRISYLHGLWTLRVEEKAGICSRLSTDSYCISIIDTKLPFTAQMTCSGRFAGQLTLALPCFSHILFAGHLLVTHAAYMHALDTHFYNVLFYWLTICFVLHLCF